EDASHCIHHLCQSKDPAYHYVTHFHLIAQELKWNESILCIQLQEGLDSSIPDEPSHTSPATVLSNLITQCLENKLNGKSDPNTQRESPSEDRPGHESSLAENQPVQAANNCPHLSEAEWAHSYEGHLCLYCGHLDHVARDCPLKLHHAEQAGNIEVWK
ncbi:RTL3 protein, partial [Crocuta crocuta]